MIILETRTFYTDHVILKAPLFFQAFQSPYILILFFPTYGDRRDKPPFGIYSFLRGTVVMNVYSIKYRHSLPLYLSPKLNMDYGN